MSFLHHVTAALVDGLRLAREISDDHPKLGPYIQATFQADGADPEATRSDPFWVLWDVYQTVMGPTSLPAFHRYLGKKRPKPADFERAIRLCCLYLAAASVFEHDSKPRGIKQHVVHIEGGQADRISMQPRPFGTMTYDPRGLLIDGSTAWSKTRNRPAELQVFTHGVLERLGCVLIEAENAPGDGTMTVQVTRFAVRVIYRPHLANHPAVTRFITLDGP